MNRRNFLSLGLALPFLASPLIAGEPKEPLAEVVPLEGEIPKKAEFKQPALENIIDKSQMAIELYGVEEAAIVLPILHPPSRTLRVNETEKTIEVIQKCKKSALALYDAGVARTIILEGLDEQCAEKHNKGGKLNLTNMHGQQTPFFDEYSGLINNRRWHVIGIPNATEPTTALEKINRNYESKLQKMLEGWDKKGWSESKERFDANGKEAMAELAALINNYILEAANYYEREDPQGRDLVKKSYYEQNSRVLALAKPSLKEKHKVVIICGALHEHSLRKEMESSQTSYAVIRAQEVPPYHPPREEEIAERVRKESLTFTTPISITFNGIGQSIEVDPQLKRRNFYKKYISPGQK